MSGTWMWIAVGIAVIFAIGLFFALRSARRWPDRAPRDAEARQEFFRLISKKGHGQSGS